VPWYQKRATGFLYNSSSKTIAGDTLASKKSQETLLSKTYQAHEE
jgi:hypothetical protein